MSETIPETKFFTCDDGSFPLHIVPYNKDIPNELISDNGTSFILHGIDLFQLKQSPLHSVLAGVNQSDGFFSKTFGDSKYDSEKVYLLRNNWSEFKFPVDQFRYVMRYFQELYDKHKTEAAVLLMLNQKTKDWVVLFVIQCSASGGSVVYAHPLLNSDNISDAAEKRIIDSIMEDSIASSYQKDIYNKYNELYDKGYRIYGTIHSHCNFNAFHSATDDHDEKTFDGLHITIGNVNSGWSYSCRYMVAKAAFPVDIKDVLGVEDMKSVEDDIENIIIEDEHMNLMMPELLRSYQPVNIFTPTDSGKDWSTSYNVPRVESYNNWDTWSKNESWPDNVWNEQNVYRVYNWKTNQVILVKVSFWNSNRKTIFTSHEIIPDGPIPLELINKNKTYMESGKGNTPNPKEEVGKNDAVTSGTVNGINVVESDNEDTDITVINSPLLNPKPITKDEPKFKKSKLFEWRRKAKKLIRGT